MWKSLLHFASLSALFLASFGVGGNFGLQKEIRSLYVQERALRAAFVAQVAYIDNMVEVEQIARKVFKDPEVWEQCGLDMEECSKKTAEELQALMIEAMEQEHILAAILQSKEDVIQDLETSGDVPPEELIRCKTDDAYFELKMREFFEPIQQAFNNPGFLKRFTNAIRNAFQDPEEALKRYEWKVEEVPKMTPEELLAKSIEAVKHCSPEDMLAVVLKNKEDVIQDLETSGYVPPEELIRCKTDDAYFELKMREWCETIQQVFNNPDFLKRFTNATQASTDQFLNAMLKQYKQAMEECSKMTPEELQVEMDDALEHWSQEDMLAVVLKKKASFIQSMETSGDVPPEELIRYKTDDAYFELKMREFVEPMQQAFHNPDYLKLYHHICRKSFACPKHEITVSKFY